MEFLGLASQSIASVTFLAVLVLIATSANAQVDAFAVSIQVDAAVSKGELHRIWRFFGADEPNYAYMKDGRKLLGQLGELAPTVRNRRSS